MDDMTKRKVHLLHKYLHEVTYIASAHSAYSQNNYVTNRRTAWIQMVCSTTVGVLGIGTWNNLDSCGASTNIGLIAGTVALSALGTLIGGTRAQMRYGEKHSIHEHVGIMYDDLASDIIIFLTGDLSDHDEVTHFADNIHERIDTTDRMCPSTPSKYIDAAKNATPFPKSFGTVCALSRHKTEIRRRKVDQMD